MTPIFVMPQIENIATVDILDEYLAVPGIDAVAIGPNDMSGTAGVFPDRRHPTITAAVDKICAAGKAHGVPVFLGVNTPAGSAAGVGRERRAAPDRRRPTSTSRLRREECAQGDERRAAG